jgi:hypothetical protein
MKAVVVALSMLLSSLTAPATAGPTVAVGDAEVCASLSLQFIPTVVLPKHTYDYNFDLVNCGSVTERLTVRLEPSGPCAFIPRSRETYVLEPGQGFSISRLMIAPPCPGDYRLRGMVAFRGRALDRDRASLRVEPAT